MSTTEPTQTKTPKAPADPTHKALDWLNTGIASAWILMILGALGGVALALQHEDSVFGGSDYPYMGAGIGTALSALLIGLIVLSVLNYMLWRVKTLR